MPNYMEIIGECYPDAVVETRDDPTVYASIVWKSTQISQAELDVAVCDNDPEVLIVDVTELAIGKVPQWDGTKWVPTVVSTGGSTVFGSEYLDVESETESSTSSTQYVQKVTMTTNDLPNGKYRIGWYVEANATSTKGSVETQVDRGGVVLGNGRHEPKDSNNWIECSGFRTETISGIQTIQLQFKRSGGNATAKVRRARLEIWRIS